jgi:dTDP-4-amino-4,6-dideoxygalactose transaminase
MGKLAITGGDILRKKPFKKWPEVNEYDKKIIMEVVESGNWSMYAYGNTELSIGNKGISKVEMFENAFKEIQHVKNALAVNSGTSALDICCRVMGISPGDEVITTPYTFISTTMCILNSYAIPVYVDVNPETFTINADLIEEAITEKTKAIIPVHFGGVLCDMKKIKGTADKYNLKIIEDAAHVPTASLKESRYTGTLGDIGIFSFQQSKILTAGEGGVITTDNNEFAEKAWSYRHVGRTKNGKWYEHAYLGWNYRMSEFQGAILLSQLKNIKKQNKIRNKNVSILLKGLKSIPGITSAMYNPETENFVYYIICLRYDKKFWDGIHRDKVVEALNAEGIPVNIGYRHALYRNSLFEKIDFNSKFSPYRLGRDDPIDSFSNYAKKCPMVEKLCKEESIWLTHESLLGSKEDMNDIIRAFEKVYNNRKELY